MLRSYPNLEDEGLTTLERGFYKNKGQFKRRVLQPKGVVRRSEEGRQDGCVAVETSHLML